MKVTVYAIIDNQAIPYVTLELLKTFEVKAFTHLIFNSSRNNTYSIFASDTMQEISISNNSLLIDSPVVYSVDFELVDSVQKPEVRQEKDGYRIVRDKPLDEEMINNVAECAKFILHKDSLFWIGRVGFKVHQNNKKVTVILNTNSIYSIK